MPAVEVCTAEHGLGHSDAVAVMGVEIGGKFGNTLRQSH